MYNIFRSKGNGAFYLMQEFWLGHTFFQDGPWLLIIFSGPVALLWGYFLHQNFWNETKIKSHYFSENVK